MKNLSILFIGDAQNPIFINWVKWFVKQGNRIGVVSENSNEIENVEYYSISYLGKIQKGIIGLVYQILKVRKVIRIFKPDIVHSHQVKLPGILGFFSGFRPHVISAWGTDVLLIPQRSLIQKYLISISLKHADLVTAESVHVVEKCKELGSGSHKTIQIRNGININKYKNINVNRKYFIDKYKLSNYSNIIISPRGINDIYNNNIVIESIPIVLKCFPKALFIIKDKSDTFSKPEYEYLSKLVKECKVDNNVKFIGKTSYDELLTLYALSDVVLSIPSSDSISVSLVEAMYMGAFPIVSNLPANNEIIKNNLNGKTISDIKSSALAEAIIETLGIDSIVLQNKRLDNAKMITQKFNMDEEFENINSQYLDLLKVHKK